MLVKVMDIMVIHVETTPKKDEAERKENGKNGIPGNVNNVCLRGRH